MMTLTKRLKALCLASTVLVLLAGYAIPLLPAIQLKEVFQALQAGREASSLVILLGLIYLVRLIAGTAAMSFQQWTIDKLYEYQLSVLLKTTHVAGMDIGKLMHVLRSDLSRTCQKPALLTNVAGQVGALSVMGVLIYNTEPMVFWLAFLPMLLMSALLARKQKFSAAFRDVQVAHEDVKSAVLLALKHPRNLQVSPLRSLARESLERLLNNRASLTYAHRRRWLKTSTWSRLCMPIATASAVAALYFSGKIADSGAVALVLAYMGSANMLTAGLLNNFYEGLTLSSSAERVRGFRQDASDLSWRDVLNMDKEDMLSMDFDALRDFVGRKVDIAAEASVVELDIEQLHRYSEKGNKGLSKGENKRLYLAVALSLARSQLKLCGFDSSIDPERRNRIACNLDLYSKSMEKKVIQQCY